MGYPTSLASIESPQRYEEKRRCRDRGSASWSRRLWSCHGSLGTIVGKPTGNPDDTEAGKVHPRPAHDPERTQVAEVHLRELGFDPGPVGRVVED